MATLVLFSFVDKCRRSICIQYAEADHCTERIIVSDVIWAFDPKKQTIYGWAAPVA